MITWYPTTTNDLTAQSNTDVSTTKTMQLKRSYVIYITHTQKVM